MDVDDYFRFVFDLERHFPRKVQFIEFCSLQGGREGDLTRVTHWWIGDSFLIMLLGKSQIDLSRLMLRWLRTARRPSFGMIYGLGIILYVSLLRDCSLSQNKSLMLWVLWVLGQRMLEFGVLGGGNIFEFGRRSFQKHCKSLLRKWLGLVKRILRFGNLIKLGTFQFDKIMITFWFWLGIVRVGLRGCCTGFLQFGRVMRLIKLLCICGSYFRTYYLLDIIFRGVILCLGPTIRGVCFTLGKWSRFIIYLFCVRLL